MNNRTTLLTAVLAGGLLLTGCTSSPAPEATAASTPKASPSVTPEAAPVETAEPATCDAKFLSGLGAAGMEVADAIPQKASSLTALAEPDCGFTMTIPIPDLGDQAGEGVIYLDTDDALAEQLLNTAKSEAEAAGLELLQDGSGTVADVMLTYVRMVQEADRVGEMVVITSERDVASLEDVEPGETDVENVFMIAYADLVMG